MPANVQLPNTSSRFTLTTGQKCGIAAFIVIAIGAIVGGIIGNHHSNIWGGIGIGAAIGAGLDILALLSCVLYGLCRRGNNKEETQEITAKFGIQDQKPATPPEPGKPPMPNAFTGVIPPNTTSLPSQ